MTELTEKITVKEMTQNQITAILDLIKVGEKLKIFLFEDEVGIGGRVSSKEPDTGGPLRKITKVNFEEGSFLERKQHTDNDFTNWRYHDEKLRHGSAIVFAVTIEK